MAFAPGADTFDPRRGLVICLILVVGMAGAALSMVRSRRDLDLSAPQQPQHWKIEFQVPLRWTFAGEFDDPLGARIRIYRWMDSELRVRRQAAGADVTAADMCRLVLQQHAELHSLQALFRQRIHDADIAGRQGATMEGRLSVPDWPEFQLKVLVAALALEAAGGGQDVYSVDVFSIGKRKGANDAAWRAVVDSIRAPAFMPGGPQEDKPARAPAFMPGESPGGDE